MDSTPVRRVQTAQNNDIWSLKMVDYPSKAFGQHLKVPYKTVRFYLLGVTTLRWNLDESNVFVKIDLVVIIGRFRINLGVGQGSNKFIDLVQVFETINQLKVISLCIAEYSYSE